MRKQIYQGQQEEKELQLSSFLVHENSISESIQKSNKKLINNHVSTKRKFQEQANTDPKPSEQTTFCSRQIFGKARRSKPLLVTVIPIESTCQSPAKIPASFQIRNKPK